MTWAPSSSRSPAPRSATPSSGLVNTRRASSPRPSRRTTAGRSSCRAITSRPARRSGPRRKGKRARSRRSSRSSTRRWPPSSSTSTSTPPRSSTSARRRARKPKVIPISIGGEIGEVGKYNTQPDEVRAYIDGVKRELGDAGMSKISVQTGTSHGGVPMPDGSVAAAKIDFDVLRETTRICRDEYSIAGAVQHGASTLPESVFNKFPESEAVEIHLATGFQNMILDAPTLPEDIREGIRAFCFENALDERKDGETDEQFVYKTRKKALGPFKRRLWDMPSEAKQPIVRELEDKFEFLMEKLAVFDTKALVEQWVPVTEGPAYTAASEELTAMATVDPNEGE